MALINFLMRPTRILAMALLLAAIAIAFVAACICWPTSIAEKTKLAMAMNAFYNQPHPRGAFNEQLPSVLVEHDRQYYKSLPSNPAWELEIGTLSIRYYYRRFGIDYEKSLRLFHRRAEDTEWTFACETRTRILGPWLYWREQPITITDNQ